jgi:proline iminopeptidase
LVYYDAFGRGKSDTAKVVTEYSLERDIEDLEGLRKAMGFSKINILGHSTEELLHRVTQLNILKTYIT